MRTKQGAWGIFGVRRGKVKDIRRKQTLETLKRRKAEKELKQKTEKARGETAYFKAKGEMRQARKKASFFQPLPTVSVKVKKKKQGKKLSGKKRIGLI